jgi:aminomethyltransferase
MEERKTPLYDRHVAAGGRIVSFGGYLLPVQYQGIIHEHTAVRQAAGLFDVSHMGEVLISGPGAEGYIEYLVTNTLAGLADGAVRYSPMCDERGGTVDDLLIYRRSPQRYLIVVNASNRHKDVAWMLDHAPATARVEDISDDVAQLALQGPQSETMLTALADGGVLPGRYYTFVEHLPLAGVDCLVSRTGYTGEDGFELYCEPEGAPRLWDALVALGAVPCGLGARDTLRLEAAMPLYGHEMDESVSPLETGLNWAVKAETHGFIGREAMLEKGAPRMRVGLKATGKGILREHQAVYREGVLIGHTTSGTFLPFIGAACAMALVESDSVRTGETVEVDVRGRMVLAEVTPLPFYNRAK